MVANCVEIDAVDAPRWRYVAPRSAHAIGLDSARYSVGGVSAVCQVSEVALLAHGCPVIG